MSTPSFEPRVDPAAAAPVFAALGDPTRLALVSQLNDGRPRSIMQLTGGMRLTRQGISKHLRVLEEAGIVTSKKVGRESLFELQPAAIKEAVKYLEHVSGQWDDALLRLKSFVEDA